MLLGVCGDVEYQIKMSAAQPVAESCSVAVNERNARDLLPAAAVNNRYIIALFDEILRRKPA